MRIGRLFGVLLTVGVLGASLTSCMFLSDTQKKQMQVTSGKISGQELFMEAGKLLNDGEATKSQRYTLSYRLAKIDRDKSYTAESIDSEEWDIISLSTIGAGRWEGQSIRDNIAASPNTEYYGIYDSANAEKTGHESSPYLVYYSPSDTEETREWVRTWRQGLFAGLVTNAIDYTKLASVGTWEVNKTPLVKDGKTLYTVTGNVSFNEARNFLTPIENALNDFTVDPRLAEAETVAVTVNIREDGYIDDFLMEFVPATTVNKTFIFSSWRFYVVYDDINTYDTFTMPDYVVRNAVDEDRHVEESDYGVNIDIDKYREEQKKNQEEDSDIVVKNTDAGNSAETGTENSDKNTASEGASKEEKGDVVDPQSNTKKNTEPEKSSSNTKKKK